MCVGTNNPDAITGTKRADTIKARGSGEGVDQVTAYGGGDKEFGGDGAGFLYGGPDADTLDAGPNLTTKTDPDFLAGEAGNDTLVESPSQDRYGFGPGWGQDTLTGDGDQPGVQSDSDGLCFACSGIVADSVNISLAAGTAADGTNSVTWDTTNDGPLIEDATGGSGADTITGSVRRNIVNGFDGADAINMADGDGADLIDCGNGTDTVMKDAGDTANNCETVSP